MRVAGVEVVHQPQKNKGLRGLTGTFGETDRKRENSAKSNRTAIPETQTPDTLERAEAKCEVVNQHHDLTDRVAVLQAARLRRMFALSVAVAAMVSELAYTVAR